MESKSVKVQIIHTKHICMYRCRKIQKKIKKRHAYKITFFLYNIVITPQSHVILHSWFICVYCACICMHINEDLELRIVVKIFSMYIHYTEAIRINKRLENFKFSCLLLKVKMLVLEFHTSYIVLLIILRWNKNKVIFKKIIMMDQKILKYFERKNKMRTGSNLKCYP